jgi:hypothetical protein
MEDTMRLPNQNTSAEALHDTYGLYHLTRLKADPNCSDLATAFQAAQNQLETRMDQRDAARASAMTALAVRDAQDAALDRQVRAFAHAVVARVNGNRRAPLRQTYFPAGMRNVISAPMDQKLVRVGAILAKLNEETDTSLTAFFEPLQAAEGAMLTALDAHRSALKAETNAFGLLRAEVIHWTDAYRRSYRDLQRMFYQDGDHAESFFRSPTTARSGPSSGEEQTSGDVSAGSGAGAATGGAVASGGTANRSPVTPLIREVPATGASAPVVQGADAA